MLKLDSISLIQFKNYNNKLFNFDKRIVAIYGKNGVGKTNLLDAIHYLCFTKSYFGRQDASNVLNGHSGFRIEGIFTANNEIEKTVCILRETGKKEFSVNDQPYEKFSKHIGKYPCVVVAPDDIQLITAGSEERRKFIDTILSQMDHMYLQKLIVYNKIMLQRNSLLRSFAEYGGIKDFSVLDILDKQLAEPANYIFEKRSHFLFTFLPHVKQLYNEISRQHEDITMVYESQLEKMPIEEILKYRRHKDCLAMRTTAGIHRDEIEINMQGKAFKTLASQGQRKSLLYALKLAEMDTLKNEKGFAPVLLLDDIFEKLDEDRISNLLQRVANENEGQVFITDTHFDRLDDHLKSIGIPYQLIELNL